MASCSKGEKKAALNTGTEKESFVANEKKCTTLVILSICSC